MVQISVSAGTYPRRSDLGPAMPGSSTGLGIDVIGRRWGKRGSISGATFRFRIRIIRTISSPPFLRCLRFG